MRFGLIANLKRVGAREAIDSFVSWAREREDELILSDDLKSVIPDYPRFESRQELAVSVDVLVSMGGDGTLLSAARLVGKHGTLLLGVNLGSLGFLTQQTPKQLVPALEAIVAGDYRVEERMLLQAEVSGGGEQLPCALNDVVVDNGPISRVVNINLRVNGEDVVTYVADGLVIATPTGSTAYSLAVGGPIVKPGMDAIIASPIAAFSLTTRPMIFSGDDVLEVNVKSDHRPAVLTLDGQVTMELGESQVVRISRADYYARFIVFPENSYYRLLRTKLHWGVSPYF